MRIPGDRWFEGVESWDVFSLDFYLATSPFTSSDLPEFFVRIYIKIIQNL